MAKAIGYKLVIFSIFMLILQLSFAAPGPLFSVTSSGTPAHAQITLCLNAQGPLSCQVFTVSGTELSIRATIPDHTYPNAGIKINTPGFVPTGCTPISNGYCIFSLNASTSKNISISLLTLMNSPLGLVAGAPSSGSMTVKNNSASTITNISADLSATQLNGVVTVDDSDCATLPPFSSCSIIFSSNTANIIFGQTFPISGMVDDGTTTSVNATVFIRPANLFIIGDATPGGWFNPVPVPSQQFSYDNTTQLFSLTLGFIGNGAYAFLPENGSWAIKYGTNASFSDPFAPHPLILAGGDIKGPLVSGTHTITVNFVTGIALLQ